VTVPASDYARLLEAFARSVYDEPKAPCSAVQTATGWIVATLVDGVVRNDVVRATNVAVETDEISVMVPGVDLHRVPATHCPEHGGLLGRDVYWIEDALGDGHLGGCSLCVAHEERIAAESRVDRAVDNAEQRAEGWR
jgi:hypothetical protein